MSTNETVLVLKVGGALMQSPEGLLGLMKTAADMVNAGRKVVLVHGGGYLVDEQLAANGMVSEKVDGLRVSPKEHMPIVVGALAGTSNKVLQGAATAAGATVVGLSLADGNLVDASIKDPRLGMVGQVAPKDGTYLKFILSQGWLPIVSSIAMTTDGELLNVNADDAATVLAKLVHGQLILLSDVPGVLDGNGELLSSLNRAQIAELVAQGVIAKGMKVKVEAALEVAEQMGQPVQVASWRDAAQLAALARGEHIGTQIQP
ncbi:acetylglutamate kinase [Shewanella sp. A3A]|nr:acetylglutamate kinase [Shewanella ferrihydritica]